MMRHVIVADRHPLLIRGIEAVLNATNDFRVVCTVTGPDDLEQALTTTDADLLLLDVTVTDELPGLLMRVRHLHPSLKVVLAGAPGNLAQIRAAFAQGAAGYLLDTVEPDEFVAGLRRILHASEFTPIGDARHWPTSPLPLTTKELLTLAAAGRGLSNKHIASELWVSEHTVKFHLSNTYRKLGVSNRTEAVRAGRRLKLLADA
jgi:DNA-binding NarL/FixJ family response regulator